VRTLAVSGLYLGHNKLTGVIPYSIGNLRNLWYVGCAARNVEGGVAFIVQYVGSRILCMNSNQLRGSIPESIGNLTSLEYVCVRMPLLFVIFVDGGCCVVVFFSACCGSATTDCQA
jgi:hypothetical protein